MTLQHTTDVWGCQRWFKDGELHREDGPAIIYDDGGQLWYKHGEFHRDDGPAIIFPNGDQSWYINGERHRVDGPAVIHTNGDQHWYINGELRRDPHNGELRRDPHNGEPMPVILEKHRASFDGILYITITAEEYDKYKYQPPGRHTKAALREN